MCLGLSSILDFVNEDSEGQRSLFTEADWAILRSCSKNRFGPEPFELPSTLDAIWDQVVKLCRQGKSSAAKSYVAHQLMDEPSDINLIKGLEIIEQLLITLKRHAVMLDPINLRRSSAETTNGYTATMKQQQYPASGSIISFRIDFRILLHHHHYQDHDRKYEKDIEEAKVKADHVKLAREAKDVLDRLVLVNIDGNETHELQGAAIQLAGLQGEISTIHLHESGVYVLIPGSRLTFPQSYASLQRFYPTMKALLQLRAELEATALVVLEQLELAKEKRNSLGTTFGRSGPSLPESQAKRSKKATWYSPPR
ncbi:unnamed protein product [Absidia cylindrospora]